MLLFFLVTAGVILLDQLTKILALQYLAPAGSYPLWENVLHLTYVENTGAAFGMMKEMVDAGEIGELTFVESEYAHDYQHMFDHDPKNWRSDPIRNGVVGGGCHAVDLLRWIAGDPIEVFG